jgi:hypothetical protein
MNIHELKSWMLLSQESDTNTTERENMWKRKLVSEGIRNKVLDYKYSNHVILMWTFISSVRRPVDRDKHQKNKKKNQAADESKTKINETKEEHGGIEYKNRKTTWYDWIWGRARKDHKWYEIVWNKRDLTKLQWIVYLESD